MIHVEFEFIDEYTHGKWQRQECIVSSLKEMIKLYGLDQIQWRIIKMEEK